MLFTSRGTFSLRPWSKPRRRASRTAAAGRVATTYANRGVSVALPFALREFGGGGEKERGASVMSTALRADSVPDTH